MPLLLLLLSSSLIAVRGGGCSEYHPRLRIKQIGTRSFSPSASCDNPLEWARGPSSKTSTRTKLPSSILAASSAFYVPPFTNHATKLFRTSVIRALLPSSKTKSLWGRCRNNKAWTCTGIHAKLDLENDVVIDDCLDTTSSNLVQFSNDDYDGVQIKNQASVSSDQTNIAVNDNSTTISPQFQPILVLCFLVTLLSALDRVAMSIAILPIASEFHYTETIKGQIASAVSYGYAAAILPLGLATSVASPKALMLGGVGLWSLATLGTPWMAGLTSTGGDAATAAALLPLLVIRAGMGGAEAVVLPTMQRILSNWVPLDKKSTVLSIVISGFQLGTVVAYLVSPLILDVFSGLDGGPANTPGWRGMFYFYGLLGLLWIIPWSLFARDAPESTVDVEDCEEILVNTMIEDDASLVLNECPMPDDAEANTTTTAAAATAMANFQGVKTLFLSAPWSDFVKSPGVWAMTLAHAAKNWELYNLLAWTPTFFNEQYGLNVKESAFFSVLPSVCGIVGGLTAGNAADFILVKLADSDSNGDYSNVAAVKKRTQVRKLFQSIALLGPAVCLYLLSNLPDHASTAQILLGGAVGLQAFDSAGFGAATQEKAGERWAGLLYSLTSLPGVLLGSVSVSVTGQLLDSMAGVDGSSGWAVVYQSNAVICVLGALAFLFFYDAKKEFD